MLIEIVKRTPVWVYFLFVALVAFGYIQSKDRVVSRGKLALLPLVMIGLSLYGILAAYGISVVGLFAWLMGIGCAVWFGARLVKLRGVGFISESKTYFVPGSWLPLGLMMVIFFIKYATGIILARRLFFARALAIWRTARPA